MKIVISTVGMSLISNIRPKDKEFKAKYDEYIQSKFNTKFEHKLKDIIKQKLYTTQNVGDMSAEIKSILKIGIDEDTHLYFITSDTRECEFVAEIIQDYFRKEYKVNTKMINIPNLQVEDSKSFETKGVKNLFEEMTSIIDLNKGSRIILNPTGGYKVVVPYITLFGMIAKKEIKYIFERTDNLIDMPIIPLSYDYNIINGYIEKFNLLDVSNDYIIKSEFYKGIDFNKRKDLQPFVIEEDGYVTFSALGQLIFHQYKEENAVKEILIGNKAKKDIEKCGMSIKIKTILRNIADINLREKYLHQKMSNATDCFVYKEPNTAERVFYSMEGNLPKVFRIFTDHDEYELKLKKNSINKTDFDNEIFEKIEI